MRNWIMKRSWKNFINFKCKGKMDVILKNRLQATTAPLQLLCFDEIYIIVFLLILSQGHLISPSMMASGWNMPDERKERNEIDSSRHDCNLRNIFVYLHICIDNQVSFYKVPVKYETAMWHHSNFIIHINYISAILI